MTAYSEVTAWAVLPTGESVRVSRCEVAIDRTWSPYAQATVTVPWTAERAAACDPRAGDPRVRVGIRRQWYAAATLWDLGAALGGMTLADIGASELGGATLAQWGMAWSTAWDDTDPWREPDELVADMVIRGRSVDVAEDTLTIRAATDELLAQTSYTAMTITAEGERARVLGMLARGGVPVVRAELTTDPVAYTAEAVEVPVSQSVWSALTEQVTPWLRRLWCDLDRTWRTAYALAAPAGAVHIARATRVEDDTDVDTGWADSLVITTRGMIIDPDTAEPVAAERVDVWPAGTPTGVVASQTRDLGRTPVAGMGLLPPPSDEEMAARLARLQEAGRTVTLVAPIDPTLRPGMALTTGAPSAPELEGVITAVRFAVPDDTVTITAGSVTESEA